MDNRKWTLIPNKDHPKFNQPEIDLGKRWHVIKSSVNVVPEDRAMVAEQRAAELEIKLGEKETAHELQREAADVAEADYGEMLDLMTSVYRYGRFNGIERFLERHGRLTTNDRVANAMTRGQQ